MNPLPTNEAYADAIRRQIEHEDVLIVNRLSWLVASQSFMFTAYAIVLNGPVQVRSALYETRRTELLNLIPALAICTCILIYLGMLGGVRVMALLHRDVRKHGWAPNELRLPIQGTKITLALGLAAPMVLPMIFALAWILILAH